MIQGCPILRNLGLKNDSICGICAPASQANRSPEAVFKRSLERGNLPVHDVLNPDHRWNEFILPEYLFVSIPVKRLQRMRGTRQAHNSAPRHRNGSSFGTIHNSDTPGRHAKSDLIEQSPKPPRFHRSESSFRRMGESDLVFGAATLDIIPCAAPDEISHSFTSHFAIQ
jgi:hypothetical protein